jgi:hypothetical protein
MILDVSKPKTVSLLEQQIGNLYVTAKEYPQIQCEEKHHFGPNIYIKEVTMPAGSLIIGKHHRFEHMCNMMSGRMIVVDSDGNRAELIAPMTFMAKPGRKIAYIIETVVFQNIYSTSETDIKKLENMLVDNSKELLEEGN